MKKINDVSKITGLSRRKIQELQRHELAPLPKHTNNYGHYLYDDQDIARLWQLRFYKELDYDCEKIKTFESNTKDYETKMESIIQALEEKKANLENIIGLARLMKDMRINSSAVHFGFSEFQDMDFNNTTSIVGTTFNIMSFTSTEEISDDIITAEDWQEWEKTIIDILHLSNTHLEYKDEKVQVLVQKIHNIISKGYSKSISMFEGFNLLFFS